MIPTKEQLEEGRHVNYQLYGYFYSFCKQNKSCEECDRIVRAGCSVKKKIEHLQTKRILRLCKLHPKEK